MKKVGLIVSSLLICLTTFCQIEVDAGENIVLCNYSSLTDTVHLAGDTTITSGQISKLYWQANVESYLTTYTASFYLDDTTSLTPRFIEAPMTTDSVYFYLTVIDIDDKKYIDSVLVLSSMYHCLDWNSYYKKKDEDIVISNPCSSEYPPFTYSWWPNFELNDTSISEPLTSTNIDTIYFCKITDAIGCSDTSKIWVHISTGVDPNQQNNIKIYPLPASSESKIEFTDHKNLKKNISIYSLNGNKKSSYTTKEDIVLFSNFQLESGYYIFRIIINDKVVSNGKFYYQK